jgi:regulator of sirC expression with transglutaminase-like and TPR domain
MGSNLGVTSKTACMEQTREISALFHLIDDPDEEVFTTVSDRLVSYGKNIIPNLEHLWETNPSEDVQERIEMIIHNVHFRELSEDFVRWKTMNDDDLLAGAILVARFQYPDLQSTTVMQEVEKIRRNVWLELNSYLTPLEQTNVVTTILYNYYNVKGGEVAYSEPNEFLINKLLDGKKGNSISNGVLYLILADLLDIPIKAVNIPKQFILGYFGAEPESWDITKETSDIQFYIDPISGQVFTQKDVETYFKRISIPPTASYFKPLSNRKIIQHLLEEFARCFDDEKNRYKMHELLELAGLLQD